MGTAELSSHSAEIVEVREPSRTTKTGDKVALQCVAHEAPASGITDTPLVVWVLPGLVPVFVQVPSAMPGRTGSPGGEITSCPSLYPRGS